MSNPTGDALVAMGLTETQQHLSKEEIHAALEAAASPSLVPDISAAASQATAGAGRIRPLPNSN